MSNFKLILEQLNEEVKKFQCCGETTHELDKETRKCSKCNAKWLKKELGWAKQSK
jgi:hypothetical protein